MGRRALRQGGGDGGAQLRHVRRARARAPGGIFSPTGAREKNREEAPKNTLFFSPRESRGTRRPLSSCGTTVYATDTVYPYRDESGRFDFNRVCTVVIPHP